MCGESVNAACVGADNMTFMCVCGGVGGVEGCVCVLWGGGGGLCACMCHRSVAEKWLSVCVWGERRGGRWCSVMRGCGRCQMMVGGGGRGGGRGGSLIVRGPMLLPLTEGAWQ